MTSEDMTGEDELLHSVISALLTTGKQGGPTDRLETDLREYPLTVVPTLGRCRRIIYTTKMDWLTRLTRGSLKPADTALLWRTVPLSSQHRDLLRAVVQSFGAPMYFIGDLDPLDLATYATLAGPGESPQKIATYLGVSDSWLERCERDLASQRGKSFQMACMHMDTDERDGFERLKQLPVDWTNVVGPRALSMLASGTKLELEGASNPDLYSQSFQGELLEFVFDKPVARPVS